MTKPRVMLILRRVLGWNTYASRLVKVAEARQDIDLSVLDITADRRSTMFHKHHDMSRLDRLLRYRDPISHYHRRLGAGIRTEVAAFRPDVVHFAGHLPAAAISLAANAPPFTVALDVTRAAAERDLPRAVWSREDLRREATLLRAASRLFPMSSWAATSLHEDYDVAAERITIMPPGVDVPETLPRRLPRANKLQIIFIGNDFRRKGGDRLCDWVGDPLAGLAELHVVSSDPDAAGDRPGVTFHGRIPNERLLAEILPGMDVLCLPTRSDMSPQVLAEAAAAGLPAITSAIAGIPDLVVNGKTGLLANPSDDASFINALRRLAEDRSLVQALGTEAHVHANRNLNAHINFNCLIDSLSVLASGQPVQAL